MKRPLIDAKFYETYHFASIANDILSNQADYLDVVNAFCGEGKHLEYSAPFPEVSAFHSFLLVTIDDVIVDTTQDVDLDERKKTAGSFRNIRDALADLKPHVLPIEEAFRRHGLKYQSFTAWLKQDRKKNFKTADADDVYDYLAEQRLSGPLDELVIQSTREVFFVLFANRKLLLHFNQMMAQAFTRHPDEDIPPEYQRYFERPGVLKRAEVPRWVQRAVFYRDQGRCVACGTDLSGLLSAWSEENYDHVIPLSAGGINDVTNIQMLCGRCNRRKGSRRIVTSSSYEDWYPYPQQSGSALDTRIPEQFARPGAKRFTLLHRTAEACNSWRELR
jgi:HNH endonuclease